jgi:hypothetical protein
MRLAYDESPSNSFAKRPAHIAAETGPNERAGDEVKCAGSRPAGDQRVKVAHHRPISILNRTPPGNLAGGRRTFPGVASAYR